MSGLLVALPLHIACQLINPGNLSYGNVTMVKDESMSNYATVLPEGYTSFPDVGVAYKYYPNKLTWNAARKQCIEEGASLANVNSFKKIGYIMGIKAKDQGIHTGIQRLFDNTEWTNTKTGLPVGFIPWKPDANIIAGTGQCVAMWFDGSGNGPWNCANVLPSVCEIPLIKRTIREPQPAGILEDSLISN